MASSRSADKYIVRLPSGMRDSIRANADANRRSMNAEIVHYLDRALAAQSDDRPAPDMRAALTAAGVYVEPKKEGPAEDATSPSHVTATP